jgi:hypothetical protein
MRRASNLAIETKNTFGRRIKFLDATGCVHGDDTIERGIEDGAIELLQLVRLICFDISLRPRGSHPGSILKLIRGITSPRNSNSFGS